MVGKHDQPVLMISLTQGDYAVSVVPERGGGIAAFTWRDQAVMRPMCGPTPLDLACFPLVPFSNRIAHGRFVWKKRRVTLAPNLPGSDHPHTLHGFGWQVPWHVIAQSDHSATLEHTCDGQGEWPWPYRAEQAFVLNDHGLTIELSIENSGQEDMPAGLGLHPYFPCDADTCYIGLHKGEWQNAPDCLPLVLEESDSAVDWWDGMPVRARNVDTLYTGRDGVLKVIWPCRNIAVTLSPSDILGATVVYSPLGEDYICVEPVSHMTDAVNRHDDRDPITTLIPGAVMRASVNFSVSEIVA